MAFLEKSLRNKGGERTKNVRAKKVQRGSVRKVDVAVGQ